MLISVQALRALAAWVVVFHHVMQVFFDFDTDTWLGHMLSTRGQMGVDIFFIISGFVIYITTRDRNIGSARFLWNRVARVAPAYWLCTLITALMIWLGHGLMPVYGVDWQSLLMSLAFIPHENPGDFGYYPVLPVGWTLNFEMLFYSLFALACTLPSRFRAVTVTLLVVVVSPVLALNTPLSSFYANPVIYEFLLGIGVGILYSRGWLNPTGRCWPALLVALGAFAFMLFFPDRHPWRLLVWGLPAALLVAALICTEPLFKGHYWLKRLGDQSYSVYLIHIIILWTGHRVLYEHYGWDLFATLIPCMALIVLLSWASFEWIETRLSHWLKQLAGASGFSRSQTR
ncbi:acyltransferase family protein [Kushneria phosphatilytica]|uniref:Acyltransferase n=1 Tax=Kushneria phosphatilytica TaxID=657387 RepID=A0A1S1NTJ5_9GAMM|nr:acyltransferase [Kushneria phosphatilytica]OHV07655.1 acyltransferase [Kushneria phosphatilytica]QEL10146.1 acyltransferase [Kushneria phosphatilytica]